MKTAMYQPLTDFGSRARTGYKQDPSNTFIIIFSIGKILGKESENLLCMDKALGSIPGILDRATKDLLWHSEKLLPIMLKYCRRWTNVLTQIGSSWVPIWLLLMKVLPEGSVQGSGERPVYQLPLFIQIPAKMNVDEKNSQTKSKNMIHWYTKAFIQRLLVLFFST